MCKVVVHSFSANAASELFVQIKNRTIDGARFLCEKISRYLFAFFRLLETVLPKSLSVRLESACIYLQNTYFSWRNRVRVAKREEELQSKKAVCRNILAKKQIVLQTAKKERSQLQVASQALAKKVEQAETRRETLVRKRNELTQEVAHYDATNQRLQERLNGLIACYANLINRSQLDTSQLASDRGAILSQMLTRSHTGFTPSKGGALADKISHRIG